MLIPEERNNTKQDPQPDAQLEKLQLEIADLRWKVKWVYRVAQVTSIMVAMVAVFAFLWNLYQFNAQQSVNAKAALEARQKENEAVDRELKRPLRERQLAMALEISNVAATIATRPPEDVERMKAEIRFRELSWGPSIFIEDNDEIKEGMIKFVNCLDGREICVSEADKRFWLTEFSKQLSNRLRGVTDSSWHNKQLDLYIGDSPVPP